MKYSFIVLLLFTGLSLVGIAQEGTIRFSVKNPPSNDCVIGYYFGARQYIVGEEQAGGDVENIALKLNEKGQGTFYKKDLSPGVYLLVFQPGNQYIEFIYEGKSMELSFDMKSYASTMKTDSKANEIFFRRAAFLEGLEEQRKTIEAKQKSDPSYDAEAAMKALQEESEVYDEKLFKTDPSNIAAQLFKATKDPQIPEAITDKTERFLYYRAHYFDNIDFNASWLLRTPFFDRKVNDYVDRLTYQVPDSINAAWDELLMRAANNAECFKYLLVKGLNKYAESKIMGQDAVYVHLLEKYYFTGKAIWMDEEKLEGLRESYNYLRNGLLGNTAKDFSMIDEEHQQFNLQQVEAEYTILFFVDLDCGTCSREEGEWKKFVTSLPSGSKLIEVVFYATTEELEKRKNDRELSWDLVIPADLVTRSSLQTDYNLRSFPKIYVLDKDKKIIAKQITPEQVLQVLGDQ